ncbi:MAG: PPIC-type domain [Candidatus Sumerlaeota bacterium]|nr:PPIC-type domain [Candidatus Sumerlaeota bacterium]
MLRFLTCLSTVLLLFSSLSAQTVAPLIREDRNTTVRVRVGTDNKKGPEPTPAPPDATPTPDPETVLVALVNTHTLTRAELDRRMSAITGINPEAMRGVSSSRSGNIQGGVVARDVAATDANLLDIMLTRDVQEAEVEDAVRREEGTVVSDWIDQMILADEARRQGIVISDSEFRERLGTFNQQFRLRDAQVRNALQALGMTQTELESYIYDALLIEKLLARYIEINYPEERLRTAYERNPMFFVTPPSVRIAQFTISVAPTETADYRKGYKRLAEQVRKRLLDGERPESVFEDVNDIELGVFGGEYVWSLESRMLDDRLREMLTKMQPGEVSDVLTMYVKVDNEVLPESFQVVKLLERKPGTGETFETALPRIQTVLGELARSAVLEKVKEARTHKVVTRLSGIPPDKLPSPVDLRKPRPPVNLHEPKK